MDEAFTQCNLSDISFPTTLESIGGWAFGLGEIKELILPVSLKEIGSYAFCNTKLECIVCLNPTPCECEENVFKNETYLYATLQVPQESLELYKTIFPWQNFFKIEGHSLNNIEYLTNCTNHPIEQYVSVKGDVSDKPFKGLNIIRYKDGSTKKAILGIKGVGR